MNMEISMSKQRNIIFGTGADAIRFYNWLINIGVEIDSYCVSEVKETEYTEANRDLRSVIEGDERYGRNTTYEAMGYTTQEFSEEGELVDLDFGGGDLEETEPDDSDFEE